MIRCGVGIVGSISVFNFGMFVFSSSALGISFKGVSAIMSADFVCFGWSATMGDGGISTTGVSSIMCVGCSCCVVISISWTSSSPVFVVFLQSG